MSMNATEIIIGDTKAFLAFMKSKYPLIHMSSIFYRDFHYGSMAYIESKGKKLKYLDAEKVAHEITADLESKGILRKIDHQSWVLIYPEFALPRPEPKAVTPVATAAPAATPASATAATA